MTAAGKRVAGGAIADDREVAATLDQPEILFIDARNRSGVPHRSESNAEKYSVRNVTHAPTGPDF
jgi:hypothetical protein